METLEYRTIDKSGWQRGEWDTEPDKRQWQDAETGLPCLIVRGPMGALCGYVGVPEGHPAHGKDYGDIDVQCHGGLTFADSCHGGEESRGICHKPEAGEPDHVWWLGFDCAHSGDMYHMGITGMPLMDHGGYSVYRNIVYVTGECASLAKQLKEQVSQ